jgi:uncharacterized protein YjbJ (UPF0337 family)
LPGAASLPGGANHGAGRGQPQGEKIMNKDQVKGRAKQAEGKIKEITGRVVGDGHLMNEGRIEKAIGKAQSNYGDLKETLKDG